MLNPTQTHYKIIHTTCHTQWGGLEKRIFNEAVWMRNHRHQVILVAPRNSQLFLRAKKERFHVYPISFSRMGVIRDYRSLVRIFQNELPDIVNTHGNNDTKVALPAAEKTNIPCRILSRHISAHVKIPGITAVYTSSCAIMYSPQRIIPPGICKPFSISKTHRFFHSQRNSTP